MELLRVTAQERFRVGDLVVDSGDASVRRGAERLALPPRTLELLLVLLRRHPGLVRRDELLDSVWRDEHVSDQTLSHRVMVLRKALGDHAGHPTYVAGERGFGYRLVAPVERLEPGPPLRREGPSFGAASPRTGSEASARVRPAALVVAALMAALVAALGLLAARPPLSPRPTSRGRATVAVRPFSGARDFEPFAAELGAAVASDLRRVSGLGTVAWDDRARPGLWVETACEGTTLALRTSLRLVDGETGRVVWSADYQGSLYDLLDREAAIGQAVARAAHEHLAGDGAALPPDVRVPIRAARQMIRGEALWYCWTPESLHGSSEAWAAAAAGAPAVADVHAGAALAESVVALLGHAAPAEAESRVRAHVSRAVDLDEGLPATRLARGLVALLFDRNVGLADRLVRTAAAEDAGDARAAIVVALLDLAEGRFADAARLTEVGGRQDPRVASAGLVHARAREGLGDLEEAAAAYGLVLEDQPALPMARVGRAWCLARAGRVREALAVVEGSAGVAGLSRTEVDSRLRTAWARLCRDGALPAPERPRACLAASDTGAARAELVRAGREGQPYTVLARLDPTFAALGPWSREGTRDSATAAAQAATSGHGGR